LVGTVSDLFFQQLVQEDKMDQINKKRNFYATLLVLSAVALGVFVFAIMHEANNFMRYRGDLLRLEANHKPSSVEQPIIRMAELKNISVPSMDKIILTLALFPKRQSIKVFLCQENAIKEMSNWSAFEAMCGKGENRRVVTLVLTVPTVTDGSELGNQRALDTFSMEIKQLPTGTYLFTGLPVPVRQVNEFTATLHSEEQRDYESQYANLEKKCDSAKTAIRGVEFAGLFSGTVGFLGFFGLFRQFRQFRDRLLTLVFAGEVQRSPETDRLMPGFLDFVLGSIPRLCSETECRLLDSKRQLYRVQAKPRVATARDAPCFTVRVSNSSKQKLADRLEGLERQYHLLRGVAEGNSEGYSRYQASKLAGDLKAALRLIYQAVREAEPAMEVMAGGKPSYVSPPNDFQRVMKLDYNPLGLPVSYLWRRTSGQIRYEEHFLSAFSDELFTAEEKTQIVRRLELFAAYGPTYPSLKTKRDEGGLPHTPKGSWVSRAADDIRFTWQKKGTIVVYWLYRRGDTTVGHSEA
jgi:hypothetical protein